MNKTKANNPKTRGIAKVPVVMQLETLECGAACLCMVLAYYGKWIPLEEVRIACGVSRDGSNAGSILRAAKHYGLDATGYKMEPEQLKNSGSFPCIIHWNFNHFVVLDGFKGDRVYLNDPAKGNYYVSAEEFDECFTGVCICFKPSPEFTPSGRAKSILGFAGKRISSFKGPFAFIALTTVVSSFISVMSPAFSRVFIDRILSGSNSSWLTPFLFILGALYFLQIVVRFASDITMMKINGKISLSGNTGFMWKLLHLPMEFFSQRMSGDLLSRQNNNTEVSNTLINTIAPLVLDSVVLIFYFVVMIRYSAILTLIGLIALVINGFASVYISKRRLNLTRVLMRDYGNLYGTTASGIRMIETIKSSGAEEGFFEKWSGNFANVNNKIQEYKKQDILLGIIPSVVSAVASALIIGVGIAFVMSGKFTLGMVYAFQGFYTAFMNPANKMINAGQTVQEMRTMMERIDDVMQYPDDEICAEVQQSADAEYAKLSGNIEIKNLSFGYAPLADPLIKDFNMSIKAGSRVAFVGASGSGKSTLSKLISGLYQPRSGEILFDGKHINEIDHSVFTGSVAVVDQDIVLFEDTIANNIKMWDDSIQDFEMILAARDAQIHSDILARPEGYQYRINEGGRDFSGGQRQRMEIARVLAQDPTVIILDEATSALDAKTEFDVVNAIKDRGITCIVIAHRLSTIRDCDEIVVLDHGMVAERGTHDELIKNNGVYTQLIVSE